MPYVILVYDVQTERVTKINKFLKAYLHWSQNSVFEGEITQATLELITTKLLELIDPKADSVFIYKVATPKNIKRTVLGIEKKPVSYTL